MQSNKLLLSTTLIAFLMAFLSVRTSQAQSVTHKLTVTQVKPMDLDRCDEMKHYMKISINGVWVTIDFDLSGETPRSFPSCTTHAPHPTPQFEEVAGVSAEVTLPMGTPNLPLGPSCDPLQLPRPDVGLRFELWEADGDIGGNNDDLTILYTGDTSAGPYSEQCFDGGDGGGVCWKLESIIDLNVDEADTDGDGLTDAEELNGVDIDCDGVFGPNDLNLPAMGVDVNRKDMLLEINAFEGYQLDTDSLEIVKAVFARAPETAGGVLTPGQGINLIIDAGDFFSDLPPGMTIGGRDLATDPSTDPNGECGSINPNVPPTSRQEAKVFVCHHDTASRRGYFRQLAVGPSFEEGVAGIALGGDRIYMLVDDSLLSESNTLLHEIGHSMNLSHSGTPLDSDDGENCEPNHISVMNYLYSGAIVPVQGSTNGGTHLVAGIPTEIGGNILYLQDFSPTRAPDTFYTFVGDSWVENQLDVPMGCTLGNCNPRLITPYLNEQCLTDGPLVSNDLANGIYWRQLMIRSDGTNVGRLDSVAGQIDWGLDGYDPSTCSPVELNTIPWFSGSSATTDCQGNSLGTIGGVDEWSIVKIPPARSRGAQYSVSPDFVDEHNTELVDLVSSFSSDLKVTLTGPPQAVLANQVISLTVLVENLGPNPAYGGIVNVELAPGTMALDVANGCTQDGISLFNCSLVKGQGVQALAAGDSLSFEFGLRAPATVASLPRHMLAKVSHDGPELEPADNTASLRLVVQPSFFGFEDASKAWVVSYTNGQAILATVSSPVRSGVAALALDCGYQQFESPVFDTSDLEVTGDQVLVGVFVPDEQATGWVGQLGLFVDIASAGIWNQFVGEVGLTNLQREVWTDVVFFLPSEVSDALSGDFPDARLRLSRNIATCGAPVTIDDVRFGGTTTLRTDFHSEPSPPATVLTSSILSFDNLDDWNSSQVTLTIDSTNKTEGVGAVSVNPTNWFSLHSREFAANELQGITQRLSFDVHVPELSPDYYWFGGMNVLLQCPSAGLWNTFVGHRELQILFDDEFNRVEFELPPYIHQILSGGSQDCSFTIEFSTSAASGPLLVDRGGFVQ